MYVLNIQSGSTNTRMSWSLFLGFLEVHRHTGPVIFAADFQNLSVLGRDEIPYSHSITNSRLLVCFHYRCFVTIKCRILIINNCPKRCKTQSSLFIILQVHSTCSECQPHPSSGVHKTVTTASGTGHIFVQLPPSNVANAWPRWREVAG